MSEYYAIAHNIRSAHNVGAILRTADGAGVAKVYLTGYTPTPIDRFGRERHDIAKAALGAERTVAWEAVEDIVVCIQKLKKQGVRVVGVEQDARSQPYTTCTKQVPTAFIFGEEVAGIPNDVRNLCDELIEIPMRGNKESLNVSVAAGVILFTCIEERT